MKYKELNHWLEKILPAHKTLTSAVVNITKSLLDSQGIEYLAITGRTKDIESTIEKVKRKSYNQPDRQLTDLSGIRIITYFESDVERISQLIESSFSIDANNSLSKASLMATNQIGYRSVHYVCDLGSERTELPEFAGLSGLKFEFQIRTVLQHAWAELAHDRNYKFSGKLPKEIERKLYLYAGMLEIADKGFDDLSTEIDQYITDFLSRTEEGDFDIEINSISLEEFVENWANHSAFMLEEYHHKTDVSELVRELEEFGIHSLKDLKAIIPDKFSEITRKHNYSTNIFGLLRDWMLIHDYKKYHNEVQYTWSGFDPEGDECYSLFLKKDQVHEIFDLFEDKDDYDWADDFQG
jgi:ppGpp synthetase/RelA/SpoT-type nucleotidyltranferase